MSGGPGTQGGPPCRSEDFATTPPSGPVSEIVPSSGFSLMAMTRSGAPFHGENGDGQGTEADMYDVKPADFADPAIAKETDGELFWKVTSGRKPMPSFKVKLSEQERWQVIDFIRTFANAKRTPAPAQK